MSNSSLVNYTLISPNKNSPRNHKIDTITIHCMAGQLSVESCGRLFNNSARQASSNYGIGPDGRIGLYVDEGDRSWASSNAANDNRAITIEVASDSKSPYAITEQAYMSLIALLTDICKRNNIPELRWQNNINLIGYPNKQNMTVHRWFKNKACPGDYLLNLHPQIVAHVNARLKGTSVPDGESVKVQPSQSTSNVDVYYGTASATQYYAIITNCNDINGYGYAGVENVPICIVAAKSSVGTLKTRVRPIGYKTYLPWVDGFDWNDHNNGYAGICGKPIDRIQFHLEGCPNKKVMYRVSTVGSNKFLPWVTDINDYAGIDGKKIDKIQVKIV